MSGSVLIAMLASQLQHYTEEMKSSFISGLNTEHVSWLHFREVERSFFIFSFFTESFLCLICVQGFSARLSHLKTQQCCGTARPNSAVVLPDPTVLWYCQSFTCARLDFCMQQVYQFRDRTVGGKDIYLYYSYWLSSHWKDIYCYYIYWLSSCSLLFALCSLLTTTF